MLSETFLGEKNVKVEYFLGPKSADTKDSVSQKTYSVRIELWGVI